MKAASAVGSGRNDIPLADSALAFDRFLHTVERPAIRVAELGEELHPRAVEHVARAMADLAGEWSALPEARWPVEFWRRLQQRLDRARGSAPARAFERLAAHEEEPASDDDPLVGEDAAWYLESALRALSAPQRMAFLLRVWEGMDLTGVAEVLQTSPDTVKSELFHALQRLHARLAPGAADRRWVLRCRALLDEWAGQIEAPSLAPLAVLLAGAALLAWRGYHAWRASPQAHPEVTAELPLEEPPAPMVELAPVAAPDYELLADEEQYEVWRDLDFYAWLAREPAAHE